MALGILVEVRFSSGCHEQADESAVPENRYQATVRERAQPIPGSTGHSWEARQVGYVDGHRVGQDLPDHGTIGHKPDRAQLRTRIPFGESDAHDLLDSIPK